MMKDFDMDKFLYDNYMRIEYESQPIGPDKIVLYLTTFDMERYEKEQILEKQVERVEWDADGFPKHVPLTYYDTICKPVVNMPEYVAVERVLNDFIRTYYDQKVMELQNKIDEYNAKLETMCHTRDISNKVGNVVNTKEVSCDVIQGNVVNCDSVFCKEIRGNTINCNIRKMKY